jgi:trans-2,3-dihydro-3-hydroxyanthranilate isomerase
MARFKYFICDVFTEQRFGGNQLAVLPEATGLSDRQMQQVAREFNFPETTFVFPSETRTRRVRIFTPAQEMPFAGHPNVGTAFVLATIGELGTIGAAATTVVFDEKAGPVPITIQRRSGNIFCELTAPQRISAGPAVPVDAVARALSLTREDIVTGTHPPQVASVGFPFLFVELRDRAALTRARANMEGIDALVAQGFAPDIHLYIRSGDDFDLRARMFAPLDGIPEDPATGSANVCLTALLAHYNPAPSGSFSFRIAQGVEMGRPSELHARAEKQDGVVVEARIGGASVLVSEGMIEVD